MSNNDCKEFR